MAGWKLLRVASTLGPIPCDLDIVRGCRAAELAVPDLRIVSFFNISSSYVSYEGCESGYRFQSPLVIMVGASLLALALATLIYTAQRKNGLARAAGLAGSTMNALYSVVVKQCMQFLHCSPSAHGGFDFTGGVAITRVQLLPDGTTMTETVYMRYAPTGLASRRIRPQSESKKLCL